MIWKQDKLCAIYSLACFFIIAIISLIILVISSDYFFIASFNSSHPLAWVSSLALNSSFRAVIFLFRFSYIIFCSKSSLSSFLIFCSCTESYFNILRIGISAWIFNSVNQDKSRFYWTPEVMIDEASRKNGVSEMYNLLLSWFLLTSTSFMLFVGYLYWLHCC